MLAYIFHPQDCQTYRWLTARWNQFERDGVVRVVGIPVMLPHDSAARQDLFTQIVFPLRPELAAAATCLMMRMGYEQTPLSVLIDDEMRIRAVIPPRPPAHDFVRETEIIREFAAMAAHTPLRQEGRE